MRRTGKHGGGVDTIFFGTHTADSHLDLEVLPERDHRTTNQQAVPMPSNFTMRNLQGHKRFAKTKSLSQLHRHKRPVQVPFFLL